MMRGYDSPNASLLSIVEADAAAATATASAASMSRADADADAHMPAPAPAPAPAPKPWLISSGTEDYFLGTFYFDKGQYFMPLAGVTALCPEPNDGAHRISVGCVPAVDKSVKFSAYRLHASADPLQFEDGMAATWRNGEPGHGGHAGIVNATTFTLVYEW